MTNSQGEVLNGINKKRSDEIVIKMEPKIAVFLKSIFLYNLPEYQDAIGHPMLELARIRPAAMAPRPKTDC
ncbi:MAG TPA: hypothetical protein PKW69_16420, partial [Niabella sp.]|nr:hypothetical protein [Niabella sp.]